MSKTARATGVQKQETMRLDEIKVGKRFRRELGDIRTLVKSIEEIGLLHPVVVDRDGNLIAGQRRLEAFRGLERTEIPVHRVSLDDLRSGEREENVCRLNLLPTEMLAVAEHFRPQVEAKAKERERLSPGRAKKGAKVSQPIRVENALAAMVGTSGRTLEKIGEVVEAAEKDPELAPLVEEMDRKGKVDRVHRKVKLREDEERRLALKPVEGKYRTIVIDPPWDHGALSVAGRGKPLYAVMGMDELKALPVPEWADGECHLYLWATNNFILRAGELIGIWGFDFKTVLTWVKPRFGLGTYFRSSTEHILFAVKGKVPTRARDIPTHFEAPLGKHSEKPQVLYAIAERASYAPRLDVFARKTRPGWMAWGAGL